MLANAHLQTLKSRERCGAKVPNQKSGMETKSWCLLCTQLRVQPPSHLKRATTRRNALMNVGRTEYRQKHDKVRDRKGSVALRTTHVRAGKKLDVSSQLEFQPHNALARANNYVRTVLNTVPLDACLVLYDTIQEHLCVTQVIIQPLRIGKNISSLKTLKFSIGSRQYSKMSKHGSYVEDANLPSPYRLDGNLTHLSTSHFGQ